MVTALHPHYRIVITKDSKQDALLTPPSRQWQSRQRPRGGDANTSFPSPTRSHHPPPRPAATAHLSVGPVLHDRIRSDPSLRRPSAQPRANPGIRGSQMQEGRCLGPGPAGLVRLSIGLSSSPGSTAALPTIGICPRMVSPDELRGAPPVGRDMSRPPMSSRQTVTSMARRRHPTTSPLSPLRDTHPQTTHPPLHDAKPAA